jgi:hypothetical protein
LAAPRHWCDFCGKPRPLALCKLLAASPPPPSPHTLAPPPLFSFLPVLFLLPPEPRGGNSKRIPREDMELVDGCSKFAFGKMFVNTSDLLSLPRQTFNELMEWEARDPLGGGTLLTMEGFHPSRRVRTVLLNALLLYFYALWGVSPSTAAERAG